MNITRRYAISILAAGAVTRSTVDAQTQERATESLAGDWRFELDPDDKGLAEGWHRRKLLDGITLPGTLETNGKGYLNQAYGSEGLARKWIYAGSTWYQRDIDVPAVWANKRVALLLERIGASRVWIDDREVGLQQSFQVVPHVYELREAISPGRHQITIFVGGSSRVPMARGASSGILGRIELFATDRVWVRQAKVIPDIGRKTASVSIEVANATGSTVKGTVTLQAHSFNSDREHVPGPVELQFEAAAGQQTVSGELLMGDGTLLWDEFHPALYRLAATLKATGGGGSYADRVETDFGMRQFSHSGPQFQINGRPVYLRGRSNGGSSPLTGHAPYDVEGWRRYFRINKEYGLNHLRAGACPPEAGFRAADLEGVYLQVELGGRSPVGDSSVQSLIDLGTALFETYGNHPSFCLLTLGNELYGDRAVMAQIVSRLRAQDSRHIYASGSNNFIENQGLQPGDDFWVTDRTHRGFDGLVRASMSCWDVPPGHLEAGPPNTRHDYSKGLAGVPIPVVAHEIGQYQVYPNYDEIPKFTGVMLPRNLEIFRERLIKAGMFHQWRDFFRASGALSVLCYKEDIEAGHRTPGFGGFQILDLADAHGQGTALVGILDAFNDSKGLITPEGWQHFCNSTVPLLLFDKYTWTATETFTADMEVAHYGPADLRDAVVSWTVKNQAGQVLQSGDVASSIGQGRVAKVGRLSVPLTNLKTPARYDVGLALRGTTFRNQWSIWVYDSSIDTRPPAGVTLSRSLDKPAQQRLMEGENVLLLPEPGALLANAVDGQFQSDFWSYSMFSQMCNANGMKPSPGTLGILTIPEHPALARFPTEYHTNWQWWHLIENSRSVVLPLAYTTPRVFEGIPSDYRPIVQVIDNVYRNQKLGLVFEFRVGRGKLLVCAIDLPKLRNRPEAAQLLHSLLAYVSSPQFRPVTEMDSMGLKRILGIDIISD